MQKIIYIILGLVLVGAIVFGGLYINGNYNDKSQVSGSFNQEEDTKMISEKIEEANLNKVAAENSVMKKDDTMIKIEVKTVENKVTKTGSFNKIDPVHYANGDVQVTSDDSYYYLKFQDNFSSANGPDLFVYLSSEQEYKNIAIGGVDTSKTLNIGKLSKLSGAQSYKVSKAEFEAYSDSVIIWCKEFGVQFSRAELK